MEEARLGGYQGYLFLLEFLVDNLQTLDSVNLLKKIGNDKCAWFRAQTRVTFQFGPYQPVEIWDEEFPDTRCCNSGESRWKSGKSCLFALSGEEVEKGIASFVVFVSAYRRVSAGFHPGDILIGTGDHEIQDAFNGVLKMLKTDPYEVPASTTIKLGNCLKKCAQDVDEGETPCIGGQLQLYARLSCYGKNICSAFHIEDEPPCFVKSKGEPQAVPCCRLPLPICPRPPISRITEPFPSLKPAKIPCKPKPPKPCPPPWCVPPVCPRRMYFVPPCTPQPCIPPVCPPPTCPRRMYFPPCNQPVCPPPMCPPPTCPPPACPQPMCPPPTCPPPACPQPMCPPPSCFPRSCYPQSCPLPMCPASICPPGKSEKNADNRAPNTQKSATATPGAPKPK